MFCPVDMAQEHNIKDMKVTYRSEGPNIKWEYFRKLHPAIPIIRIVTEHMEEEFGTYKRGKSHTVPTREKDIQVLQKSYHQSQYHIYTRGRTIEKKDDKAKDFIEEGMGKLHSSKVLYKWRNQRSFKRSVAEDWSENESDNTNAEDDGASNETPGDDPDSDAAFDRVIMHGVGRGRGGIINRGSGGSSSGTSGSSDADSDIGDFAG